MKRHRVHMGFELSPNADGKVIENADSKITNGGNS